MCAGGRGAVDTEGLRGGWTDGYDARAELDANGHIVKWGEATFAEANGELWAGSERAAKCGASTKRTLDLPVPLSPMQTSFAM